MSYPADAKCRASREGGRDVESSAAGTAARRHPSTGSDDRPKIFKNINGWIAGVTGAVIALDGLATTVGQFRLPKQGQAEARRASHSSQGRSGPAAADVPVRAPEEPCPLSDEGRLEGRPARIGSGDDTGCSPTQTAPTPMTMSCCPRRKPGVDVRCPPTSPSSTGRSRADGGMEHRQGNLEQLRQALCRSNRPRRTPPNRPRPFLELDSPRTRPPFNFRQVPTDSLLDEALSGTAMEIRYLDSPPPDRARGWRRRPPP